MDGRTGRPSTHAGHHRRPVSIGCPENFLISTLDSGGTGIREKVSFFRCQYFFIKTLPFVSFIALYLVARERRLLIVNLDLLFFINSEDVCICQVINRPLISFLREFQYSLLIFVLHICISYCHIYQMSASYK